MVGRDARRPCVPTVFVICEWLVICEFEASVGWWRAALRAFRLWIVKHSIDKDDVGFQSAVLVAARFNFACMCTNVALVCEQTE